MYGYLGAVTQLVVHTFLGGGEASVVTVPDVPGAEWAFGSNRTHYVIDKDRSHWRLTSERTHWILGEE